MQGQSGMVQYGRTGFPPQGFSGHADPRWGMQSPLPPAGSGHHRKSYMNLFGRFPYNDDYRQGLLPTPGSPRSQASTQAGLLPRQETVLQPQPKVSQPIYPQLTPGAFSTSSSATGMRQLSLTASRQGLFTPALGAPATAQPGASVASGQADSMASRSFSAAAGPSSATAPARPQQPYMPVGRYAEQYMRAYKKSPFESMVAHPSQDPFQGHPLLLSSSAVLSSLPPSSPQSVPQQPTSEPPQQNQATALQAAVSPSPARTRALAQHDQFAVEESAASAPLLPPTYPVVTALPVSSPLSAQPQAETAQARGIFGMDSSSAATAVAAEQSINLQQPYPAVQMYPEVALPRVLPYPQVAPVNTAVPERFPVIHHARTDTAPPAQSLMPLPSMQFSAEQTPQSPDASRDLISAYPGAAYAQNVAAPEFATSVRYTPVALVQQEVQALYVNPADAQQPSTCPAAVNQSSRQSQADRSVSSLEPYSVQGIQQYSASQNCQYSQQYSQQDVQQASQPYNQHCSVAPEDQQYGCPVYNDVNAQQADRERQPAPSSNAQDYSDVSFAPLSYDDSCAAASPAHEEQNLDEDSGSDDGQYHTEQAVQHSDGANDQGGSDGSPKVAPGSPQRPSTAMSIHSQEPGQTASPSFVRKPYAKAAFESCSIKFAPGQLIQLAQQPNSPAPHPSSPAQHFGSHVQRPGTPGQHAPKPMQSLSADPAYAYAHHTASGLPHTPSGLPYTAVHYMQTDSAGTWPPPGYAHTAQMSTPAPGGSLAHMPSAGPQLGISNPNQGFVPGLPDQAAAYVMPTQAHGDPAHTAMYSTCQQQQQQQVGMHYQTSAHMPTQALIQTGPNQLVMQSMPQQQQQQQQDSSMQYGLMQTSVHNQAVAHGQAGVNAYASQQLAVGPQQIATSAPVAGEMISCQQLNVKLALNDAGPHAGNHVHALCIALWCSLPMSRSRQGDLVVHTCCLASAIFIHVIFSNFKSG